MSSSRTKRTAAVDTESRERPAGSPATRKRICEATLRLAARKGVHGITMAAVATAARVSRQALYLHFADRTALLLAVVDYADERHGLSDEVRRVSAASSGRAAIGEMVSLQARLNPKIWPLARVFDGARRQDAAAEQTWQDRLEHRLEGCRAIVARLHAEGALKPGLSVSVAADLLWTMTSLRMWEDLVVLRGWSAEQYQGRLTALLEATLVR